MPEIQITSSRADAASRARALVAALSKAGMPAAKALFQIVHLQVSGAFEFFMLPLCFDNAGFAVTICEAVGDYKIVSCLLLVARIKKPAGRLEDFIEVGLLDHRLKQTVGYFVKRTQAYVRHAYAHCWDAESSGFYIDMSAGGYDPNAHIDVLPQHRLIYVNVPKCASTSVKMILSHLNGRNVTSLDNLHRRRATGLQSPFEIGIRAFRGLATDAAAMKFTFVRNPYDRLVSAWADKFQSKSLTVGDPFIEQYLENRAAIDPALPEETDGELGFADFVTYATATATRRLNAHWQVQDDIVKMPGLEYTLIGHIETFNRDIAAVLDHVGASATLRRDAVTPLRISPHRRWQDYYTPELARRVYRAYERDFDRFRYASATGNSAQAV